MPSAPIRIRPLEDGRLMVQLPYSPDHVAKIKTVAGRRWHDRERHWTVPQDQETLGTLLSLFPGKPVDVDPALEVVRTHGNGKSSPAMLVSVRSFPRRTGGRTRQPGKKGATIFTRRSFNGRSRRPFEKPEWSSMSAAIPSGMPSPHTCWKPDTTSARFRN
jgi:hypothetical protein